MGVDQPAPDGRNRSRLQAKSAVPKIPVTATKRKNLAGYTAFMYITAMMEAVDDPIFHQ
jgi:hypothetical protein